MPDHAHKEDETSVSAYSKALMNILEDSTTERSLLRDSQKAVLNILDDFSLEKDRLQDSQRAVLNILEDFSGEKERLQDSQRAVLNILDDFAQEKERLQDMQRAVLNILEDLHVEKQQLIVTQDSLKLLTGELEERVQRRTDALMRANDTLADQAQRLQRASKYKSEFLANMSHELRTPLNSILILAKILADNPEKNLSEKQIKCANVICGSGTDLLTLINDILDLSKIEAGKMQIDLSEVPIAELVARLTDGFTALAAQKELNFRIVVGDAVPRTVRTDQKRLEQVLKNLLANAFKFTKVGGVRLKIATRVGTVDADDGQRSAAAQTYITFSVIDTGIGIPSEKQQLIFEAFQQADGSTSRQFGGTGLGLSISMSIARLLGGDIRVESQPDQGSVFMLSLPIG